MMQYTTVYVNIDEAYANLTTEHTTLYSLSETFTPVLYVVHIYIYIYIYICWLLLVTNMVAQLSFWPIRIYFPNLGKRRNGRLSNNYKFKIEFGPLHQTLGGRCITYQDLESKF